MISNELYPFQRTAVDFIESHGGRAILGDEMGLGKTIEALAWLDTHPEIEVVEVFTPANVVGKWKEEVEKWTSRSVGIVRTYQEEIDPAHSVHIASYNVMTHRWKEYRTLLREGSSLLIWDESHYLKGYRKKVRRVAAALKLHSTYMLALSGTPFLNKPIELFNILDMVQPGVWKIGSYGTRYCGGFDHWAGPLRGATHRSELKSRLEEIMIRRLKRDVLDDLPPISRIVLPVDIRTDDYKKAMRGINRTNAATKVTDAWHILGREKAKLAVEWVNDFFEQHEENKKLIIYAHHLDVIDYLKEGLLHYGTFSIDGRVPARRRDALIKGFQKGSRPRVAIINKAGGEGIDLFGVGDIDSSTILFVERQWTPALEEQAVSRLDRIGQANPVTAFYLLAVGTFDPRMDKQIAVKRKILDDVVGMEVMTIDVKEEVIEWNLQ